MNAKTTTALAAFLGGVALGALAGLLFAPEKGSDTRAKIVEDLIAKIKDRIGCACGDETKCIKEAIDELA